VLTLEEVGHLVGRHGGEVVRGERPAGANRLGRQQRAAPGVLEGDVQVADEAGAAADEVVVGLGRVGEGAVVPGPQQADRGQREEERPQPVGLHA
jgi:hypothetical protein